jgi:hypothetical protein
MQLNLGSIRLPLNAATKTLAILAKRGAGNSYTGAVLADRLSDVPSCRAKLTAAEITRRVYEHFGCELLPYLKIYSAGDGELNSSTA